MAECLTVDQDVAGSTPVSHPLRWDFSSEKSHFLFIWVELMLLLWLCSSYSIPTLTV
jgi:hypothetical protein